MEADQKEYEQSMRESEAKDRNIEEKEARLRELSEVVKQYIDLKKDVSAGKMLEGDLD